MTAGHVYRSLVAAVDRSFSYRADDVDIRLLRPLPADALIAALGRVEGVSAIEAWGGLLGALERPDGTTSARFGLLSPPPATRLLSLPVAQGRWIAGGAPGEAVVTRNLIAKEPVLGLGQTVTLTAGGRHAEVGIVGIVEEVSEPAIYIDGATHDALAGAPGLAGALRIVAKDGEAERLMARLDDALFATGAMPILMLSRTEFRQSAGDHFVILLVLLGTAAGSALLVGGLSLAASTSIGVTERTLEIGVMRAIGGEDRIIRRLFLGESLAIALVAILIGIVLALPLSLLVGTMLGAHGLHVAVPFRISTLAILLWIAAALIVAGLAAFVPVRAGLRRPVRDMLAYE